MFLVNKALVCVIALAFVSSASIEKRYIHQQYIPQYENQLRTLSGFGQQQQQQLGAPRTRLTVQAPQIIAAPLSDSVPVLTQSQGSSYSSAPAVQVQSSYSAPAAPVQSSYSAPAAPVQSSYSAPEQSSYSAPAVQVQSSYSAPAAPVQQSYSAPAAPVQSSYSAPAIQVAQSSYGSSAPAQSSYDSSYGQTSPMALFMSQPAIQQLITTMVQQYHGNQLTAPQELPNTCSIGFTQPIYESNQVTETYCRCPTGSYGFTCTENFNNPCLDGSIEFTAADSRVPSNYFLKCSWGIPYLNKCPSGTVRWSQELHACVSDEVAPAPAGYGGYGQQQTVVNRNLGRTGVAVAQSGGYGQQTAVSGSSY
jgi:hypothetical protein